MKGMNANEVFSMIENPNNNRMFMVTTYKWGSTIPTYRFITGAFSLEELNDRIDHMRNRTFNGSISPAYEVTPRQFYRVRCSKWGKGREEELDKIAEECNEEWLEQYKALIHSSK